jgi:hypothetical protein
MFVVDGLDRFAFILTIGIPGLCFLFAEAIMPVQSQLSNDPVTICLSVVQRLSRRGLKS